MTTEAPVRVPVNSAVVSTARRQAQLDLEEAVAVVNKTLKRRGEPAVDAGVVQSWESGEPPTLPQADAIAKAYLIPFVALFQESPPKLGIVDFRLGPGGRAQQLSYETMRKINRFAMFYLAARTAASGLGEIEDVQIPRLDQARIRDGGDIEEAGNQIRLALGISDDLQSSWRTDREALRAWNGKVQERGVFIFSQFLPVQECRGASKWEPGGPPAILLNTGDATPAQAFTLLHEFTHLAFSQNRAETVLCDPSGQTTHHEENMANRVAAAALVPISMLKANLPATPPDPDYSLWPLEDRSRLKTALKVSQAVIGIRLQHLRLVSDAGVPKSFWRPPSQFWGRNKPVWQRYRRYLGDRGLNTVRQALQSDVVSVAEVSRLLGVKAGDVLRIFAP